jgi:hypothetical protein
VEAVAGIKKNKKTSGSQRIRILGNASQQVFEFIEVYYDRVRRHSANGWVTPVEFERLYHQNLETTAVHSFGQAHLRQGRAV